MKHFDVMVLGAGMVGIASALHLQSSGRSVVLVDRRGSAEETSHGNAGLIQCEGVVPYSFPREIDKIVNYAFNRLPEANLHWRAIPWLLPFVYRYWRQGSPERVAASARALKPLVERSLAEHEALIQAAGIGDMVRRTGYLRVFRTEEGLARQLAKEEEAHRLYGVRYEAKTPAELSALEPHLQGTFAGAVFMPDPASVDSPGAVGKAYAKLFAERGGQFIYGDARGLQHSGDQWTLASAGLSAREAVIALGPWTAQLLAQFGVHIPMGFKRGYHMRYAAPDGPKLKRPILDSDFGYLLTPEADTYRLTTGAEFARLGAPPTPVQLARVEPAARGILALGERLLEQPWLGARPCFPDMVPVIGPVPGHKGLWVNTGHHHLGFTLGPVSGRLLASLMTGEAPLTDPAQYNLSRF